MTKEQKNKAEKFLRDSLGELYFNGCENNFTLYLVLKAMVEYSEQENQELRAQIKKMRK